ncbi:MAG: PEP-CTERM sorting domain-containing protein [Thiobacillaceae bacterium]
MNTRAIKLSRIALLLGVAGIVPVHSAQAALLGVTQTYPDVAISTPYVVYDHNGFSATTGQLRVFSTGTQLGEGAAAGGSIDTQLYAGQKVDLTINVNNITGAFVSGTVSIGVGAAAAEPQWSWTGTITNFGFGTGTDTRSFDATWIVTSDTYSNMPLGLSQFVNGYLTGASGGLTISTGLNIGNAATCSGTGCVPGTLGFGNDWILGPAAQTTTALNSYYGGTGLPYLTSPLKINIASITSDVFATPVPEPAAYGMMLSGLALLAPLMLIRREKQG